MAKRLRQRKIRWFRLQDIEVLLRREQELLSARERKKNRREKKLIVIVYKFNRYLGNKTKFLQLIQNEISVIRMLTVHKNIKI